MAEIKSAVHNHLLCLDYVEGQDVIMAPSGQVSDLLPIGCLVILTSVFLLSRWERAVWSAVEIASSVDLFEAACKLEWV